MATLDSVQQNVGITFPALYLDWFNKGYTNYKSDDYLWVHEAEWMPPEEMTSRECVGMPVLEGFVPFAFSGAGDWWCWYAKEPSGLGEYEYNIWYGPHDDDKAERYAPSFIGWFYRCCLDHVGCVDPGERERKELQKNLSIWTQRLRESGATAYADHLAKLAATKPFEYRWGPRQIAITGLISIDDVRAIVARGFGNEFVDQKMRWML